MQFAIASCRVDSSHLYSEVYICIVYRSTGRKAESLGAKSSVQIGCASAISPASRRESHKPRRGSGSSGFPKRISFNSTISGSKRRPTDIWLDSLLCKRDTSNTLVLFIEVSRDGRCHFLSVPSLCQKSTLIGPMSLHLFIHVEYMHRTGRRVCH